MKNASILLLFCFFILGCNDSSKETKVQVGEISNSLIRSTDSPIAFQSLTAEEIKGAAGIAIDKAKALIDQLINRKELSYEATLDLYDKATYEISKVLFPMELFMETNPREEIRTAAREADEILKAYMYELAIDEKVYNRIKSFSNSEGTKNLSPSKKQALELMMLEYKQSGMDLPEQERNKVKEIKQKIDKLGVQFSSNISKLQEVYTLSKDDTAGINAEFLAANKNADGTYSIDMSYPSYDAIMTYAKSDKVRRAYAVLFKNRGMPNNTMVLDSVLYLRLQLANLLGYERYSQYAIATRMAKTPEAVWEFENDLKEKVRAKADYDLQQLKDVKSSITGVKATKLEEHELGYYTNILKKEKYKLDDELLSEYFELGSVIEGLFGITESLLGLRYEEVKNPDVWHPDVRQFKCFDANTGVQIGRFYLDLFPRENKYSHAACFPMNSGLLLPNNKVQMAEASLVCNFTKPKGDKPALLKHDEVETFFHEFGHLIHCMVAKSDVAMLSGLNTVKLDFVEAPSQIYENWAYLKETLGTFAKHYKTGEVIPDELVEKIIAAKNLNSGKAAQKQVFYASYDLYLHDKYVPFQETTIQDVTDKLYKEILSVEPLEGGNFHASFGHLIGYGSGYYGYMWSKVYAQDMWSVFEEKGAMNKELGMKYRRTVLEPGGAKDHLEAVKEFLGREPNSDALLKELGVNQLDG